MTEATVAPGQVFPSYLSTTGRGCSYPAIANPPILDEFESDWYSSHLLAAGELPLTELAAAAPSQLHVRFVWLRSFDNPVVIRVDGQPEGGAMIEAKRLSGAGGYDPGEIAEQIARQLTSTELRQFQAVLENSGLESEPAANCDMGLDGAAWILEVIADGHYSYFDRWSPQSGPVRDVALSMISLTGWKVDPVY